MDIFIPSIGRYDRCMTLEHLPKKLRDRTWLVVPDIEIKQYKMHDKVLGVPKKIVGIGATRHYILTQLAESDKAVMLDDDLRFDVRRKDDPSKFKPCEDADVLEAFAALSKALSAKVPHASLMARDGANRFLTDLRCTRMLRVLAYHVPTYRTLKLDFKDMTVMEDFYVTLTLLTQGKPNVVLHRWIQDQRRSGMAGGCSLYRTLEMQAAAANELHRRFPKFVKVVEKKTISERWGGTDVTRTDVQIQWKQAYITSGAKL